MSKPCVFCGGNAEYSSIVHAKIKSWVLKPFEPYPMCNNCIPLNRDGNDNALVDLVCAKWNRISKERDEEKKSLRQARKQARLDSRGSGDFLGMVDTAYSVKRIANGKVKTNKFSIFNEKSRGGEIEQINGEVDFGETYIKILKTNLEVDKKEQVSKLKELTDRIKTIVAEGVQVSKRDIEFLLEQGKVDYSQATLKRVLNWLVENKYFDHDDKTHKYWKVSS